MKRLALVILVVAGCNRANTAKTEFAIDPTTGVCTPIENGWEPNGWQSCDDPCASLDEHACKRDLRCQAVYHEAFAGCRAVPELVDPCKNLDATACTADSRCELQPVGEGCDCAAGAICNCPNEPAAPQCGLKACSELDANSCSARPDCTTSPPAPIPTPVATGVAQPRFSPPSTTSCSPVSGCDGANEDACSKQHACIASYDDNGHFSGCGQEHCESNADCAAGQRCNSDGNCVVAGCAGDDEAECNADLSCEPLYTLECSPYGNGGGGGAPVPDSFCGQPGGGGSGGCGGGVPTGPTTCQPSFGGCQAAGGPVVTGKSVLVRDPAILDDPYWALPRVLGTITGADPSAVADAWLAQLGTATTVGTETAVARPGAAAYFAALPHRSDGLLDATQLGFVPTALSNRLDLADGTSCGEARIAYALAGGATDRQHRMTVIVEMRQPYDGAHCRTVAQSWLALSQLDGAALQSALQSIYAPLITPTNLKQVRTNEFLVGFQDPTQQAAWELREFHLGTDARLHQALLPLQIDPTAASASPDFYAWAQANSDALKRGTATFPAQYQVPTGSENGTTVSLADPNVANVVNASTCAGCHTTATNSAFAHVGERWNGTGRAEISQFLVGELPKRAAHLGLVAAGLADAPLAIRPLH